MYVAVLDNLMLLSENLTTADNQQERLNNMTIEKSRAESVFREVHQRVTEEAEKEKATHDMYRSSSGSDSDHALDIDLKAKLDVKSVVEELAKKLGINLTTKGK